MYTYIYIYIYINSHKSIQIPIVAGEVTIFPGEITQAEALTSTAASASPLLQLAIKADPSKSKIQIQDG